MTDTSGWGRCEACGFYYPSFDKGGRKLCAVCAFMAEKVEAGALKPAEEPNDETE